MIASEALPYVKTGGLADVVSSLSRELALKKEEVSVFIPLYNQVRDKLFNAIRILDLFVNLGWRNEGANIYFELRDGVRYYFVENRHYFERENIYGYDDDGERFAFFNLAVIKAMEEINLSPDIIHLHDWQTGMIPCLLKENPKELFKNTKYVFSIHNPVFQGILEPYSLGDLYNLPSYIYESGKTRFYDRVSTLKAGIDYADKIVTVSPTHRNELLTSEGGMGLEKALEYREYDFCGFLNGIDYNEFDPEFDNKIAVNYDVNSFAENKPINKKELCKKLSLKNADAPLFSMISRVTWQKGMTLVFSAVHEIVKAGGNVIILGSGQKEYEQEMDRLHMLYPDQVAVYIGYNNNLAHEVYAGSDFFMMPSLFEPCGLSQMISQRYGTLPIIRRVGGLKDSVIIYDGNNGGEANGFGFDAFTEYEMIRTCLYAMEIYKNKELMNLLVKNALLTDNSWKKRSEQYLGLYLDIAKK